MSLAIDFAVRTAAGGTAYGQVAGPDGSSFIQTGLGDSVSLNISSQSVLSYRRDGQDLLIELVDGRVITLADWFDGSNEITRTERHLYLSSDGIISEIRLSDMGDGMLIPEISVLSTGEKWSPVDDLRFGSADPVVAAVGTGEDDPAGMGIFTPALLGLGGSSLLGAGALVGGGLLVGGGGESGGTGTGDGTGTGGGTGTGTGGGTGTGDGTGTGGGTGGGTGSGSGTGTGTGDGTGTGGGTGDGQLRSVDGTGSSTTITTNTTPATISVTGRGRPGDSVTVTVGDSESTVIVGPTGRWVISFSGTDLPSDGSYTASAVFTGNGSSQTLSGPGFVIDLTPPPVGISEGSRATGDVENIVDYRDGVTLRGTTEPGAQVSVTIDTVTRPAIVAADGTWTVTFTQGEIGGGERDAPIVITATDRLGNVTTLNDTLVLDTIAPPLGIDRIAGDDVINADERSQQIALSGTAAPNATISLQIQGIATAINLQADASGIWTHTLPRYAFGEGDYTRLVTATTMDAAGNVTTATSTLTIDTEASVSFAPGRFAGDDVVSLSESQGVLALSGMSGPGTVRVEVAWLGHSYPATLNPDGSWSLNLPAGAAGSISQNSLITVTAWDDANNRATADRAVRIDLETSLALEGSPVGADNVLTGLERSTGFVLDGTAEPSSTVHVFVGGASLGSVPTDMQGRWAMPIPANALPMGEGVGTGLISAYSIDGAGNRSSTVTHRFDVDTMVRNFTFAAPDLTGRVDDGARDAQVLNATERASGLVVQGTVEPDSRVTVQLGTWQTTIPADETRGGTWQITIPASAIPQGVSATATVLVTATDRLGNISQQLTQSFAVDTVVAGFDPVATQVSTGGDNTLNAREHAAGLPISGTAEAGSVIRVSIGLHTLSTVAESDGRWSVAFTSAQLPDGELRGVTATVTATDPAGNSSTHVATFDIDTIAPNTPTVIEAQDVAGALRGLTTVATTDIYTFHRIDATGAPILLTTTKEYDSQYREDEFRFQNTTVPDGSYLVINTADAAGNDANTLFIKNTETGVDVVLSRQGLQNFDLSAIDLTRAPDAQLTISESQLLQLTGPDQTLLIKGESTDRVTLQGVTGVRDDVTINGAVYDIYTLGSHGATVLLEDDVTRVVG